VADRIRCSASRRHQLLHRRLLRARVLPRDRLEEDSSPSRHLVVRYSSRRCSSLRVGRRTRLRSLAVSHSNSQAARRSQRAAQPSSQVARRSRTGLWGSSRVGSLLSSSRGDRPLRPSNSRVGQCVRGRSSRRTGNCRSRVVRRCRDSTGRVRRGQVGKGLCAREVRRRRVGRRLFRLEVRRHQVVRGPCSKEVPRGRVGRGLFSLETSRGLAGLLGRVRLVSRRGPGLLCLMGSVHSGDSGLGRKALGRLVRRDLGRTVKVRRCKDHHRRDHRRNGPEPTGRRRSGWGPWSRCRWRPGLKGKHRSEPGLEARRPWELTSKHRRVPRLGGLRPAGVGRSKRSTVHPTTVATTRTGW
jgi:hypothetical protein